MSLVEQELITLPEHLKSPSVFSGVRVTRSFSITCMFCRLLFILLYFFIWPLCYLFFYDIRIMIAPMVSSNSSYDYRPSVSLKLMWNGGIFWLEAIPLAWTSTPASVYSSISLHHVSLMYPLSRRVWRYQRGTQKT